VVDLEALECFFIVQSQDQQQQAFIELHRLAGGPVRGKQTKEMVVRASADDPVAKGREQVLEISAVLKDDVVMGLRAVVVLVEELGAPNGLRGLAQLRLQMLPVAAGRVTFIDHFFEVFWY